MPSLRGVFDLIRGYTSTQLLLFSAVLLTALTASFGILFAVLVLFCYLAASSAWNINITSVVHSLAATRFRKIERDYDFSETKAEITNIKHLISKSFIRSWTSELGLDESLELSLTEAVNRSVDRLISVTTDKQFSVYPIINDLINGAHLHIIRYHTASVDSVQSKHTKLKKVNFTVKSRFLEASVAEWGQSHEDLEQSDYLREVTNLLVHRLLAVDNPSPIATQVLTSIISENVLGHLLQYLSQQENLLKIIIRIFSEDFEQLLQSAEIYSKLIPQVKTNNENLPIVNDSSVSNESTPSGIEVQNISGVQQHLPETDKPGEKHEGTLSCITKTTSGNILSNVEQEDIIGDKEIDVEENISPGQFVTDDLTKYFRIAPNASSALVSSNGTGGVLGPPTVEPTNENGSGHSLPMMTMAPAIVTNPSTSSLPMAMLSPAARTPASQMPALGSTAADRRLGLRGSDSQSFDSGVSDECEEAFIQSTTSTLGESSSLNETGLLSADSGRKFLSVSIPSTTTRQEKQSSAKYTLYVIEYDAVYPMESGEAGSVIKRGKLYRRYREFRNLRARLEKSSYSKSLKRISGPSLWQQLSLGILKPAEVMKRRLQLERFLQQLIAQPVINTCKDLEEFLAYSGNAEIEFVQEKIEFIPQAARLDKAVIRTVAGMFDKVTDKLGSQPNMGSGSPDSRRGSEASNYRKSKPGELLKEDQIQTLEFSDRETVPSDMLIYEKETVSEEPSKPVLKPAIIERLSKSSTIPDDLKQSTQLANSLLQVVLILLQNHSDLSKNKKLVTAASTIIVPLLAAWLRAKVCSYSTPSELSRLLRLFRGAIWPDEEETPKEYDISKLRNLATQCIINDIPKPVTFVMELEINKILDDVLMMTEIEDLNSQLGYSLLSQLLHNSLALLVK